MLKSVKDITAKIDTILIPFIEKLEGNLSQYEQEWINNGFFSDKKGYQGLGFVMNLKFIAAYFGKDKAEECLRKYVSTLTPEDKQRFIDALTGKMPLNNHKPSIYGKYSEAKELGLKCVKF